MNIDRELLESLKSQLSSSSLLNSPVRRALDRDDVEIAFDNGEKVEYEEGKDSGDWLPLNRTNDRPLRWGQFNYRITTISLSEQRNILIDELGYFDRPQPVQDAITFLKGLDLE